MNSSNEFELVLTFKKIKRVQGLEKMPETTKEKRFCASFFIASTVS